MIAQNFFKPPSCRRHRHRVVAIVRHRLHCSSRRRRRRHSRRRRRCRRRRRQSCIYIIINIQKIQNIQNL